MHIVYLFGFLFYSNRMCNRMHGTVKIAIVVVLDIAKTELPVIT